MHNSNSQRRHKSKHRAGQLISYPKHLDAEQERQNLHERTTLLRVDAAGDFLELLRAACAALPAPPRAVCLPSVSKLRCGVSVTPCTPVHCTDTGNVAARMANLLVGDHNQLHRNHLVHVEFVAELQRCLHGDA